MPGDWMSVSITPTRSPVQREQHSHVGRGVGLARFPHGKSEWRPLLDTPCLRCFRHSPLALAEERATSRGQCSVPGGEPCENPDNRASLPGPPHLQYETPGPPGWASTERVSGLVPPQARGQVRQSRVPPRGAILTQHLARGLGQRQQVAHAEAAPLRALALLGRGGALVSVASSPLGSSYRTQYASPAEINPRLEGSGPLRRTASIVSVVELVRASHVSVQRLVYPVEERLAASRLVAR